MSRIELGDYCGRCLGWIWGKDCPCGRFKDGVNVEQAATNDGEAEQPTTGKVS